MSKDLDRAFYLKRLLDEQRKKVDHTKDSKERMKEAQSLMDEAVGPAWRLEIEMPDIEVVVLEEDNKDKKTFKEAIEHFYCRVDAAGDKEGLGEGPDAPSDPEELKKRIKKFGDK